jgi:hypothetical protein
MPAEGYNFWRGETSLLRPVPLPLDATLSRLCRQFAESDEPTRARVRASISMGEFYTLLLFGKRAAAFAIRERTATWVTDGLTAVAMIEVERVDFRDIYVTVSLLHHAAGRVGADPNHLLLDAARRSEPGVASLIEEFVRRTPEQKQLQAHWGYDEVETAVGVGFIGWGFRPYHPTYDLKHLVIEVADFLATDTYQPTFVVVATELPRVWLAGVDDVALARVLASVRAGAQVSADLRPEAHPKAHTQSFHVFLVETADEAGAGMLLELSTRKTPTRYGMLRLAEGRLFCLVIGRSYVGGVESFETTASLARFSPGLQRMLRRYVESSPR